MLRHPSTLIPRNDAKKARARSRAFIDDEGATTESDESYESSFIDDDSDAEPLEIIGGPGPPVPVRWG